MGRNKTNEEYLIKYLQEYNEAMVDLNVDLGGLKMSTPVTTASGTFG